MWLSVLRHFRSVLISLVGETNAFDATSQVRYSSISISSHRLTLRHYQLCILRIVEDDCIDGQTWLIECDERCK